SVMVIIVLLNVAFTCATPEVMFLRSRRRGRATVALAILLLPLGGTRRGRDRRRGPHHAVTTSSCPQSRAPCPCGSARWCASAGRAPEAACGAAGRDSSRGPSAA